MTIIVLAHIDEMSLVELLRLNTADRYPYTHTISTADRYACSTTEAETVTYRIQQHAGQQPAQHVSEDVFIY